MIKSIKIEPTKPISGILPGLGKETWRTYRILRKGKEISTDHFRVWYGGMELTLPTTKKGKELEIEAGRKAERVSTIIELGIAVNRPNEHIMNRIRHTEVEITKGMTRLELGARTELNLKKLIHYFTEASICEIQYQIDLEVLIQRNKQFESLLPSIPTKNSLAQANRILRRIQYLDSPQFRKDRKRADSAIEEMETLLRKTLGG